MTIVERVLLIVSSGAVGFIGGAALVLRTVGSIHNNPAMLNLIEGAIKSWPPETLELLNRLGVNMMDAGKVIEAVSDGEPNELPGSPPHPSLN